MRERFLDENFELAQLDFRTNDHFVDLRELDPFPDPTAWNAVDVSAKRIAFLADRHPCAFCEGLLVCHGYLRADQPEPPCRRLFGVFAETLSSLLGGPSREVRSACEPNAGSGRC